MTIGRLENWQDIRELVLMSVGTDKGRWWADKDFGSEIWKLRQTGKITPTTVGTFRQMVLDSVQWLIDDGLAESIDCEAEQQGRNTIAYCVTVHRLDGDTIEVKEAWNGI
nr:phage GP46 family protein [uncultured Treponema sp.]